MYFLQFPVSVRFLSVLPGGNGSAALALDCDIIHSSDDNLDKSSCLLVTRSLHTIPLTVVDVWVEPLVVPTSVVSDGGGPSMKSMHMFISCCKI